MVTKESKLLLTVIRLVGKEKVKGLRGIVNKKYKAIHEKNTYRCTIFTLELNDRQLQYIKVFTKDKLEACESRADFISFNSFLRVKLIQSCTNDIAELFDNVGYELNKDYTVSVLE